VGCFVVVDFGVGHAGVVVDDGVDVGLAHQRVPVLVAGLVGCGGAVFLALLAAHVAPASAVGDVAELLHVNVQHRPGMVVLVATDRFAGSAVNVGEPVQARVDQDAVNRRGAIPSRRANWTGPSLSRSRRFMHRRVVFGLLRFGERWGLDDRSCMDSPAR